MELYEVMRTTFAARDFTDEPVTDGVLSRILDNARFAPSGGNRQGWRVLVVRSAERRAQLAELIAPTMRHYVAQASAGEAPFNSVNPTRLSQQEMDSASVPQQMLENLVNAPVLLLTFVDMAGGASFDRYLQRPGVISGASIYPFVWNILLSARHEGLGGTLTTWAGASGLGVNSLFGVPDQMAFAAMLPLGYPVKQLTKLRRRPVADFTFKEHWNGEPLDV